MRYKATEHSRASTGTRMCARQSSTVRAKKSIMRLKNTETNCQWGWFMARNLNSSSASDPAAASVCTQGSTLLLDLLLDLLLLSETIEIMEKPWGVTSLCRLGPRLVNEQHLWFLDTWIKTKHLAWHHTMMSYHSHIIDYIWWAGFNFAFASARRKDEHRMASMSHVFVHADITSDLAVL